MHDGLVDPDWWRSRQDAWLAVAVTRWEPRDPLCVLDHLSWRRRHPAHLIPLAELDGEALAAWFVRIDHWADCADFDVLRLLHLWFGHRAELTEPVREALADRFVGFKYWFTDPTPPGVVDHRWYWSENHRLIFHTIEYLAGQAFPDAVFANDGATGSSHRARAAQRLHAWFDEKVRYGFTEWHSDVYYEKDLAPLLTLVEWADDPAVAGRAQAFLDLLLFDIALHTHCGNVGATHGRSYMKDKSRASDQPLFAPVKLLFDDTDEPWVLEGADRDPLLPLNEGASLLAAARRYRPPEVLRRVATDDAVLVDREHLGLAIDPDEPLVDHPTRDDGLSYDDPDLVAFWWDRDAFTAWQLIPLTMDTMDRHRLWDTELFSPFRAVREVTGGDRDLARRLAHDLADVINAGLLTEVETLTYRTAHVMLSTALDHRPGRSGYQQHAWQATLDERAVVFTTHPANEPWPDPTVFHDGDHYWTGSATLPRSAQHGPAAIHLYAPRFDSPTDELLSRFRYLELTHAYLPTECFDEVVTDGHWVFGRRRGGFVALWSWRPTRWRHHDPTTVCTNGLTAPFDLVAEGGAANVWVVEVGDVDRWGSFADFRSAIAGAAVEVVDLGPRDGGGHRGFEVTYHSPGAGHLELGPTGPLRVDGAQVALDAGPRFENRWCRAERGATRITIEDGPWGLELDLREGTSRARGPAGGG